MASKNENETPKGYGNYGTVRNVMARDELGLLR